MDFGCRACGRWIQLSEPSSVSVSDVCCRRADVCMGASRPGLGGLSPQLPWQTTVHLVQGSLRVARWKQPQLCKSCVCSTKHINYLAKGTFVMNGNEEGDILRQVEALPFKPFLQVFPQNESTSSWRTHFLGMHCTLQLAVRWRRRRIWWHTSWRTQVQRLQVSDVA